MKLSTLAQSMKGSEIVALGNAIAERIRQGETIYNYTIGDFDPAVFPIPKAFEELIVKAYREGHTNYPPGDGLLALRKAVAHFMQRMHGLGYDASEIQIAAGGRPLIYTIFKVLVDEGDKLIYAAPSWNNNHYTHMNGGEHCVIEVSPENHFLPQAADIAPHLAGATLLCLCSPQNPTGTTHSAEELTAICELVLQENARRPAHAKKLYLMYDQMYGTLTYGQVQHYSPVALMPEMKDYTIYVDGISKAFAATGVRVGWSMGPAPVIAKMKALLSHIGAWAPMAEQHATAQWLMMDAGVDAFLQGFKAELNERLQAIYKGITALKTVLGPAVDVVPPQAALYLTVKFDFTGYLRPDGTALAQQKDVGDYLLTQARLAIVPFSSFGASASSPWYRISVGTCTPADIADMLAQLEKALVLLKKPQ